ncbi:hypothetical protein BDW72DRAFT_185926 [Aspergillus terricola var. indicus]
MQASSRDPLDTLILCSLVLAGPPSCYWHSSIHSLSRDRVQNPVSWKRISMPASDVVRERRSSLLVLCRSMQSWRRTRQEMRRPGREEIATTRGNNRGVHPSAAKSINGGSGELCIEP